MSKFKPLVKDQILLLPQSINDYIPEGHLARLINRVVDQMDTKTIEMKYSEVGQKTYHPKLLLKLLFYGYAVGERSGRTIARKTETDTAYIYLGQMYRPDFRTINDFRKNHIKELKDYFVDIVRLCKELGLIKIGQINIDGTKIKANAANRRTKDQEGYESWHKKVAEKIDGLLEEAERVDTEEDELYGSKRGDELPEQINTEEKLKKKLEEVLKRFKNQSGKINATDPDAKFMKGGDGKINTSYNAQVAVTAEQFIVGSEVLTEANDREALVPLVKAAEETLGSEVKEVSADGGYSSYENYAYLAERKKVGYIPDNGFRKRESCAEDKYTQENFVYDTKKDVYVCPEGKILRHYKIRRSDAPYRRWRQVIYKATDCPGCPQKSLCTKQPYRTISRDDRRALVEEMRERLRSKEGEKKYKIRMYTTEPVFGHLKHNLGYRNFLLRTLEKVKGEFKLMCIGHNLKKMHRMMALAT